MSRRALRGALTRQVGAGMAELLPDPDRRDGWLLMVAEAQQSHVDLADPTYLTFEYVRRIGHAVDLLPPGRVRALHLGGGAMTLARYVCATRPGSTNLVVECDAALVQLVRDHLPWPSSMRIRVRVDDARTVLDGRPEGSADLIILDVFNGAQTPGSVTTVEAFGQARRVLGDQGTLVANLTDRAPWPFLARAVAGLRATFPQVILVADPGILRGRRFGNVVLIAGPIGVDAQALSRACAGDPWPARVVTGADVDSLVGGRAPFRDGDASGSPEPPRNLLGGRR